VGGLGRYLVSFFIGALISKFRVKEPGLDALFPPNIYRLILVGIGRGGGVVNGGF
jgi:hypothetical protein